MACKPPIPEPTKAVKPPVPAVTKFLPPWETGTAGPVVGIDTVGTCEPYDFRHVHPRIQTIRRLFVAEYVKDFSGTNALARMGFTYTQPASVANRWLQEPYTQHILDKYVEECEGEALVTRNKILASLVREANSYGLDSSGASRVSALGKLAKILGLEITKIEANVAVAGGIMLVPMGGTPDDWERNAAQSQRELKQAAKA